MANEIQFSEEWIRDSFSLKGRVAIVTGGASGLGLGITDSIVKAGARVAVIGSREYDQIKSVLEGYGDQVRYYSHDITKTEQAKELTERIFADMGRIDILVNNAGNHCKKPIEEMTVEDFNGVLNLHLTGAFALTKEVVPYMKRQKWGSILFQASMTSYIGMPNVAGYATAKSGYLGLVHTLAVECGTDGVRVNAIAPGWIDTPMFHQATDTDPQRLARIMGRIPMKKTGLPEDIGKAAVFLCSDAARYITGVCLPVDGGGLIGF